MLITMLVYLDWGFRCHDFFYASLIISVCYIDIADLYWLIILHRLSHLLGFCHDCSDRFTCIHSLLYITRLDMLILWLVYYFDRLWAWCLYHYSSCLPYSRLSCVDMSDLSCTLLDCMMHDYSPFAWLCAACLCEPHIYPLTSNSLGFGHSFHPGSHYCKCETFCVLALWPSRRLGVGSSDGLYRCTGAFRRRATLRCQLESDHWRPVWPRARFHG